MKKLTMLVEVKSLLYHPMKIKGSTPSGFNNLMLVRRVGDQSNYPLAVSLEMREICDDCKSTGVRSTR